MFSPRAETQTWLSWSWRPPYPTHVLIAFLGPFVSFVVLEGLSTVTDLQWTNGSFGAAAVILFAIPTSTASIPRHVICGQIVSALVTIGFVYALPDPSSTWIRVSLSVAVSTMVMKAIGISFPPGGATAYIIASEPAQSTTFFYLLFPLVIGSIILVAFTMGFEKIRGQRYPAIWL